MTRKAKLEYHSQVKPDHVLTKEEALDVLRESDHGFIAEGYVSAICAAFGVPTFLQRVTVNSRAYKGLNQAWDDDGNELADGTVLFGADAAQLAESICHALKVEYLPQFGRGSQLRMCVKALVDSVGLAKRD